MRKPCRDKKDTNKGAWSKQEDQKLIDYIRKHGEGRCWRKIPREAGLFRCGKSCRRRWINYLRPNLKRCNFGEDEDDLIIKLHALLGNRWSLIAGRLPGRTDNQVKNYWNSHLSKKLINMGIDPNNHRLSHNLSRPLDPNAFETSSSSSTLIIKTQECQLPKYQHNNDQVSNVESFQQNEPCVLPDLNLQLAITMPNPSISNVEEETIHKESNVLREPDFAPSPTIMLFK